MSGLGDIPEKREGSELFFEHDVRGVKKERNFFDITNPLHRAIAILEWHPHTYQDDIDEVICILKRLAV
jgi:hypothetical protein